MERANNSNGFTIRKGISSMFKREYIFVYTTVSVIFLSYAFFINHRIKSEHADFQKEINKVVYLGNHLKILSDNIDDAEVKFLAYVNSGRDIFKYQTINATNNINMAYNEANEVVSDDEDKLELYELHNKIADIERQIFSHMKVAITMMPEDFNVLEATDSLQEDVDAGMLALESDQDMSDADMADEITHIEKGITDIQMSLNGLILKNNEIRDQHIRQYKPSINATITVVWLILLLCLIIFAAMLARKNVEKKINEHTIGIRKLASGERPDEDELTNDMYDAIIEPSNRLLKYIEEASLFAQKIGDGNFDYSYKVLGEQDILGNALLQMRNRLQTVAKEDRIRNWQNEGQSKFVDIIRQNDDFLLLGDMLISNLVNYLGASQGILYTLTETDHDKYLEVLSVYAYSRKKYLRKRVEIGEGLAGQVFLEGKTILLNEIHGEHFMFQTGLGESKPQNVLIVPLIEEDKIEGVIEIATLKPVESYQKEFVEKIGQTMAAAIRTAKLNESTRKLLQEAQEKAEQMRAQEEELRQNMEELQATQEQMDRVKKEREEETNELLSKMNNYQKVYKKILDELPSKIFLKDDECRMVIVNKAVLEAHNQTEEELIGKNDIDFFGEEVGAELIEEEKEVLSFGKKEFIQQEIDELSQQEKYLHTVKMPFYIDYMDKTGILGFQFDITEYAKAERELEKLKKDNNKEK